MLNSEERLKELFYFLLQGEMSKKFKITTLNLLKSSAMENLYTVFFGL